MAECCQHVCCRLEIDTCQHAIFTYIHLLGTIRMNCAHWESLLAGWFRGGEHVGPYLPRDQRDSPFVLLEAREIQRGTACYRIEVSHREFSYIRTQWLVPVSPRSKQEQMFGLLKFEKNCVIRCHSKTMPDPYQPRGYLPHFRQCGEVTNISHIFPPPSC